VTFADVHVGLQQAGATVSPGTTAPSPSAASAGHRRPGGQAFSDPSTCRSPAGRGPRQLPGRKLAVSFHVPGSSGPMTWHAKALQTSYVSPPGAGSHGAEEGEAGFPFSTTSWFFLDAVEMKLPADAFAVVAFGDSITDGTNSTLNGDDRWPDVLGRRLRAALGNRVAVVNAGIGGNQVIGPADTPARDRCRAALRARPPGSGRAVAVGRRRRDLAGGDQRPRRLRTPPPTRSSPA
jgi:hypothetical protein